MDQFPKKKKKDKFDEVIDRAAEEWNEAFLQALEKRAQEMPEHVFSPEFNRKMHELIPAVDPVTGELRDEFAEDGQNE